MKEDLDKRIDDALKTEFEFSVSSDFAMKVVRNMEVIYAVSDRRLTWLIGISCGLGLSLAMIAFFIFSTPRSLLILQDYIGWIVAIPLIFLAIQYLDKKLVINKIQN
ncbi:MAG: hypothetical protein RIA69_18300 [Cyclobacteriaceae bacterium]